MNNTRLESIIEEVQDVEAKMNAQIIDGKYTRGELQRVFSAVQNPDDWRDEIAVIVPGELVNITVKAIEFFTATTPTVTLNTQTMQYAIYSVGYRMGPAGDH